MSINFDLNDLQAFRAVVEQGSFRRAADAIRSFHGQYPRIKIHLFDASANEVSAAVASGVDLQRF